MTAPPADKSARPTRHLPINQRTAARADRRDARKNAAITPIPRRRRPGAHAMMRTYNTRSHNSLVLAPLAAVAAIAGCGHPDQTQLNAPPQGAAPCHPAIADYYAYHNDQGMMADMSIADIHFLPHT